MYHKSYLLNKNGKAQKEINSKLDQIIEKNTSNDSMNEEKFT